MITIQQQKSAASMPTRGFAKPSPEASTVGRMAQKMLELASNGRIVDRDALIQAGFTRAEISAHSEDAADLANATGRAG
ncbi:hypothetical protein [Aminobacter aminovorans]|uniref:hypothetical protein n=1 Tax=Aminobacter aminovorans TaxID=83263 RepID=UPI0028589ABD|nr:hypothetical protein [Aminobacter aminovorans]MDR7220331.1 hypothetical protein [Aminobacter aminovorans]